MLPTCAVQSTSNSEGTYGRVMLHTNEVGKANHETTLLAANNHEEGVIKIPIGPRMSLREAELVARARHMHEEEVAKRRDALAAEMAEHASVTTAQSAYQAPETSTLVGQTRVPRGRNGSRLVDSNLANDLTRSQVDALDKMKLDVLQQTTQYTQGVAVTKYSHAIACGVGLDFAATSSDSVNPFARSTAFTNEIRDPTKRHGEAMEQASSHDVRLGMSLHQRSALQRLVHAFKEDAALQVLVLDRLGKCVDNTYVTLANFRAALSLDIPRRWLSEKEIIHIFMHFDVDHIGAIRYMDFVMFCDDPSGHMILW